MTDDMSRLGEPVGEPTEEVTPVDDVIVRAQEGLAEAHAAGADAGLADAAALSVTNSGATNDGVATTDAAATDEDHAFAARYAGFTNDEVLAEAPGAEQAEAMQVEAAAPTVDAVVTASEPVAAPAVEAVVPVIVAPVVVETSAAPQPIFVQAPLPPTPRGNRGVGALIGLLAAVSFAVLYLAAYLGLGLLSGEFTFGTIGAAAQGALTSMWLWVTTAVFYLAFLLFVAIANRARWGIYVILGILVGVASYGGHLVGQLFQAPFWSLTASQGVALVEAQLVAPLAFIAFVIGRELTIWFGAWVAMHGRRATEYNREALLEYERTLEAGPTLTRE